MTNEMVIFKKNRAVYVTFSALNWFKMEWIDGKSEMFKPFQKQTSNRLNEYTLIGATKNIDRTNDVCLILIAAKTE